MRDPFVSGQKAQQKKRKTIPFRCQAVGKHELAVDLHTLELLPAFAGTADLDDKFIRHLDQEIRIPLKDDMPLALRWARLEEGLKVVIKPPPTWFE